ncbi:post-GPI attachment to proteins factor 3 [Planococcus citri]|uniref:post-GPI attachment to proteins factor 3 n=1 Tax=Planococcus citri TaxID=170843 RepID=UPI0031F92131
MYNEITFLVIIIYVLAELKGIDCSVGDTYPTYRSCVTECTKSTCESDGISYVSTIRIKWYLRLLWNCRDNCEYECIWPMVRICLKKGWEIPQFSGKWPFIRWLGMQEPASVIFSILNLISSIYMYNQFRKAVRTPFTMYWIWTVYAGVSSNAWIWSVVFHIRDIPFTERMDYISASTLVYYTFYAFGYRMIIFQKLFTKVLFVCGCLFFFVQHTLHLIMKPFDYHYNFDTLVFVGILTGVTTLLWCLWNWNIISHVKYATIYVSLTTIVALLEVFDFPPVLWVFDAHSMWHLATVPLPYFIYKFAIEDCRYLRRHTHRSTVATVGRS